MPDEGQTWGTVFLHHTLTFRSTTFTITRMDRHNSSCSKKEKKPYFLWVHLHVLFTQIWSCWYGISTTLNHASSVKRYPAPKTSVKLEKPFFRHTCIVPTPLINSVSFAACGVDQKVEQLCEYIKWWLTVFPETEMWSDPQRFSEMAAGLTGRTLEFGLYCTEAAEPLAKYILSRTWGGREGEKKRRWETL